MIKFFIRRLCRCFDSRLIRAGLAYSVSACLVLTLFLASCAAASAAETVDTDNDGYPDDQEIEHGYSPFNPKEIKIADSDVDQDGLSDYWELKFKTDPFDPDTDKDGYLDGVEIDAAYDPISGSTARLPRRVEIDLKKQKLTYFVADQPWKKFPVSTGKASMPTPAGTFKIINKVAKAWSKAYGLWMPYWLGLNRGEFGIHELPVWPNGYREGEDHLGKAVSHGCIRLGVGAAEYLYERVEVGQAVIIK
ncbi:MAG: L,D-transpeptidase family protein [Patescibacteria group bacterium]